MYTGPKLTNNNLVFGIDTGYGIADNDTETRFNKGEPTTNYVTDGSILQGGWGGSFSLIDSATKSFKLNVSSFNGSAGSGQGWRSFMWDMRSHAGSAVTISATIEVSSDSPGDFAWVMMGQANSGSGGTSTNNYLGYSAGSERYQKTTDTKERISWSGTIGNTGTANVPNGVIGFTLWYNGGTSGTDHFIRVSNVQIEKKSHETPFINGTRSNVQGLIDLTKSTDLTLSTMTYDSTGQPDYDGTNDYINLGNYTPIRLGVNFTIECVVRPEQDKWMYFFHKGYGSNNSLAWGRHSSGDDWFFSTMIGGSYQNHYMGTATLNKHCHLVATYDGVNLRLYENGDLKITTAKTHDMLTSSASAGIGGPDRYWNGKIPVTKIYSEVLTTEEVVSNFKAYKNRFNI